MNNKRLKIAFDIDDTIINFTEHVLKRIGVEAKEETLWGFKNYPKDVQKKAYETFIDKEFIRNVPIDKRIKKELNKLSKKHDIFFVTAVYPEAATERILYLQKHFPDIDSKNIIIAGNKNIFDFDIFFDDRFENLKGDSTHRILVNNSWNKGVTRYPIARNFDDMLEIIKMVEEGKSKTEIFKRFKSKHINNESIVLIQGHTGSGKNYILNKYLETENNAKLEKVRTTTTRQPRKDETEDSYNFIDKDKFLEMIENDEFIEYTIYDNNFYGTEKRELKRIIEKGKRPVIIVDEKGVESFNKYTNNVVDVYIKRNLLDTIDGLVKRDGNSERIKQLIKDYNFYEKHKCRCVLYNYGDIEKTLKEFESCILY